MEVFVNQNRVNNTKMEKERGNLLSLKKWRDLRKKGTHKHTEASLKRFNYHRCLSRSEESKCIWTHAKDSAMGSSKRFSDASMYLCVPFIQKSLHFLVKVSFFFSYFCIIHFLVLSLSRIGWIYTVEMAPCVFTLFWLAKMSVSVKTSQLIFRVLFYIYLSSGLIFIFQ